MRLLLTPLLAIGLCTASCAGGTGFGGAGFGRAPSDSGNDSDGGGQQLGESVPVNGTDEDDEAGNEPAEVAGAFLTCTEDPDVETAGSEDAGVSCVVRRDQDKVDLESASLDCTVDVDGVDKGCPGWQRLPPEHKAHVSMTLKRADLAKTRVHLKVTDAENRTKELTASITQGPSTGAADDTVSLGDDYNLQLGNGQWNWAANADCLFVYQAQRTYGQTLVIPIVVKSEGTLAIDIPELCGVSTATNTLQVMKSGVAVVSETIPKHSRSFNLPATTLPAGSYELVITANDDDQFDIDDFMIGNLVLTATGEVEIGRPTESGANP